VDTGSSWELHWRGDPALVVSPQGAYNREGTVTPAVSGYVSQTNDGWLLENKLGNPSYIMKPNESRGRAGALTERVEGLVPLAEGRYGQAWAVSEQSGVYLDLPTSPFNEYESTVLIR